MYNFVVDEEMIVLINKLGKICVESQYTDVSVHMMQRVLGIGFTRASRLIKELVRMGYLTNKRRDKSSLVFIYKVNYSKFLLLLTMN